MRVVYCDAALINNLGHFASHCRAIVPALRKKSIETRVLAHSKVEQSLKDELGAEPFFSIHPNAALSNDPLCGWLISFEHISRITSEELDKITDLQATDLFIFDSTKPAQLKACIDWAQSTFTAESCPGIIMTCNWFLGIVPPETIQNGQQWAVQDTQSIMYRYAALSIQKEFQKKVRIACYDPTPAKALGELCGREVLTLPHPMQSTTSCRLRGKGTPTIAFLGEQRPDKGFHLVPEIVRRILDEIKDIHVIVQNSWDKMKEQMDELHGIAGNDEHLELIYGSQDGVAWAKLLDRCDLIVVPYDQSAYAAHNSGIAIEAVANAIPSVVPSGTGMANMLSKYGMPGVISDTNDPVEIVNKIKQALGDFDELAKRAKDASALWVEQNGSNKLVRRLISLTVVGSIKYR